MRKNKLEEWMTVNTLILHLVNHKQLSDKQIRMLVLNNEDKTEKLIMILSNLRLVNIDPLNRDYQYKKPDVTQLNI